MREKRLSRDELRELLRGTETRARAVIGALDEALREEPDPAVGDRVPTVESIASELARLRGLRSDLEAAVRKLGAEMLEYQPPRGRLGKFEQMGRTMTTLQDQAEAVIVEIQELEALQARLGGAAS